MQLNARATEMRPIIGGMIESEVQLQGPKRSKGWSSQNFAWNCLANDHWCLRGQDSQITCKSGIVMKGICCSQISVVIIFSSIACHHGSKLRVLEHALVRPALHKLCCY